MSKPRSFYEHRYKAAARVYTGNKASMVRQNNAQIAKYVQSVIPIPRDFVPPAGLRIRDLIIDVGELHEEDLGKRYWLVRERTPRGLRSCKVYSDLPSVYDIDKTLFSKGTLGTLLSYRALLSVRAVRGTPDFQTRAQRNATPSSTLDKDYREEKMSSSPARSAEFEPHSVTLRFFLENGSETKELYAPPTAGRIVLKKLKLQLGLLGIEAIDTFEVSRKSRLAWTPVQWSTPIQALPGDVLFFRKVGVTHMPGWDIDRHYL